LKRVSYFDEMRGIIRKYFKTIERIFFDWSAIDAIGDNNCNFSLVSGQPWRWFESSLSVRARLFIRLGCHIRGGANVHPESIAPFTANSTNATDGWWPILVGTIRALGARRWQKEAKEMKKLREYMKTLHQMNGGETTKITNEKMDICDWINWQAKQQKSPMRRWIFVIGSIDNLTFTHPITITVIKL
jgi:hypothetical protein